MPGEVGSLGKASLTAQQLSAILSIVLTSLSATQLTLKAKSRVSWSTLDATLRRQLELCARLLACAQRQFLVDEEWKLLDDPNDLLTRIVRGFAQEDDEVKRLPSDTAYPSCPPSILANSPWAVHVLAPLLESFPEVGATGNSGVSNPTDDNFQSHGVTREANADNDESSRHPLIDCIVGKGGEKSAQRGRNGRILLLVITACAEAFPSGRCWSSTSHKHWFSWSPDNLDVDDIAPINACSLGDFAVVVRVVANVLEASGDSSGDPELQMLALLCLIRLTGAHRVLVLLLRQSDMAQVAASWRKVWSVLFATDMRYAAYSGRAAEGTCGELVLILITEMIQGWCTDPLALFSNSASMTRSTFLYRKQGQVWGLPAFGKGIARRTKQSFDLMSVFLRRLCLSDESRDDIPDSPPFSTETTALDNDIQKLAGRRFRLVCVCLQALDSFNPVSPDFKDTALIMAVTACLSALVKGKDPGTITTFASESQNLSWTRSSATQDLRDRFCFTELPTGGVAKPEPHSPDQHAPLFESLWASPMLDPGTSSLQRARLDESIRSDCVLAEKTRLYERVQSREVSSPHIDYVATKTSNAFHPFLRAQLKNLLRRWDTVYGELSKEEMPLDPQKSDNPKASASVHCLWLKIVLSLTVLWEGPKASTEVQLLQDNCVDIIHRIKNDLSRLCENRDEFYPLFEQMLQIVRFLSELSATVSSFEMPSDLGKNILSFDAVCDSLLLSFSGEPWDGDDYGGGETVESMDESDGTSHQKKATVSDLLDDSDEDDVVNMRTATKRQGSAKGMKRKARSSKPKDGGEKKKGKRNPRPPDPNCASLVGSILITLKPSVDRCEKVVGYLLREGGDGEVDLEQAYHCLNLLSDASVIFHDNAVRQIGGFFKTNDDLFRHRSPISVFCDVFDSLRASAPTASSLHMFGYQLCSDCVRLGDSDARGNILNADESNDLVERILSEDDSLDRRPYLRCVRLQAATSAFIHGKDTFHASIDSLFPKHFVIQQTNDLSAPVRRYSMGAVAAALRILDDKEKIVKAVRNLLPPITLPSKTTEEKRKSYQEWYQHKELGSGDVEFENQVFQDALGSMEVGSIDCLAVVAGVNPNTTRDVVYDFVKLSAWRPELEAACFRACGKIAALQGYDGAEALLGDHGEILVGRWLESGATIADIPLLVSSPKALSLLLRSGQQSRLYASGKAKSTNNLDHMNEFDAVNLRDVATDQFVARHRSHILPHIFVRLCKDDSEEGGTGPEAKLRVSNNRLLKEFSVCLRGNDDDTTIRSLVQGRQHDIAALCAPMAASHLSDLGKKITELVANYLADSQDNASWKGTGKTHLTVLRILELSGKEHGQIFPTPAVDAVFSEAIAAFVDTLKPAKDGDILSAAGTSLTECFLYARLWLASATLPLHTERRWGTVALLFDLTFAQIRQKRFKHTQLSFGVNLAVDVVLDANLHCIHSKALGVLKQAVEEITSVVGVVESELLRAEFLSVARRLVGALMKKHEESQQELLRLCKSKANAKLSRLQKSLGLLYRSLPVDGGDDVWGWDSDLLRRQECPDFVDMELKEFNVERHQVLADSILGTFNLLLTLYEKADVLELGLQCFVGCMPPYSVSSDDQKALASMDPRFCAQTIAVDFVRRKQKSQKEAQDLPRSIRFALEELQKRSTWIDDFSSVADVGTLASDDSTTATLTISRWMLKAELAQLELKLRHYRVSCDSNLHGYDVYRLIQELSYVCGAPCPQELKIAASRCLGELDITLLDEVFPDEPHKEQTWVSKALEADSVLCGVQAKAIGVLAGYLHSEHPRVAISALETIIALLATEDGTECWELVDEKAKRDLVPVLSKKKRHVNKSRMQLSKLRLESIQTKAGLAPDDSGSDREWCWNKKLWCCGSGLEDSYEAWICDLVPALIECCYRDEPKRPGGSFYCCCQMIAAIAPNFAEAIFPAIVIDLLTGYKDSKAASPVSRFGNVLEDTWMGHEDSPSNRRLSSRFETLLQSKETHGLYETRAMALALDTIDLLRRATQSRFQNSENHRRNSNAVGLASSKKSSKSARSARSPKAGSGAQKPSDKREYNKGLDVRVPWKGVPYGSVLKLNGSLVVSACIRVKRFASALFYSELYFENCFGGSGAIMERLALNFAEASSSARSFSKFDISGYHMDGKASDASEIRERALKSLKQLSDCYSQLYDEDSYQAATRQATDLEYSGSDPFMLDEGQVGYVFAPSLDDLQKLDSASNLSPNLAAVSLQTADTLEALGLRNLLQRYIGSINWRNSDALSTDERQRLREKWFESRLYSMNWNEALSDCDTNLVRGGLSSGREGTTNMFRGDIGNESDGAGFHEAIMNALSDFAREDLQSCEGLLKVARLSLLEPLSAMATVESSMHGLPNLIERLQYVNDIENLIRGFDTPDTLLERWGFMVSSENGESPSCSSNLRLRTSFHSAEFAPHMREAMLRFFRANQTSQRVTPKRFDPQRCLIEHLSYFSRWCRDMKYLQGAEASLQRLRGILQPDETLGDGNQSWLKTILEHRLEEASLCESRGDFSTAVRLSKQTISLVNQEKAKLGQSRPSSLDDLLVDAYITCGNWLFKYKIEPARSILDSYHMPGATLAKSLFKQNQKKGAKHIFKSQIALARLASGLYDSISGRVKSLEWVKAGRSLAERERELRHCETMLAEKGKGSQSRGDEFALVLYSTQLRNEIQLAKTERVKTEDALRAQVCLAVQSFATALSISGVGEGSDMSRHVFRMVYLWLKHCSEGKDDADVNAILQNHLRRIPSFRFVPLASQLFAQIDQKDRSAFQQTLHTLVEKLCVEHPYHCMVQLVSVCNGNQVGGGVSGRGADVFVENSSRESKINAGLEIAATLKKGTTFVCKLLENYESLMSAYIQLANAPTAKLVEQQKTRDIALSQAGKGCRLDRCLSWTEFPPCVLTKPPPVRPGCDYGDGKDDPIGGERIRGFESTFAITDSGLHRPKIVMCEGSRGGRFRQLVKGEDEIRQDAVMEQVFTYVNGLMRRNRGKDGTDDVPPSHAGSISRELRMVTYNIVPLSPASGVSFLCDCRSRRCASTKCTQLLLPFFLGE
jgi:hypothetical protein